MADPGAGGQVSPRAQARQAELSGKGVDADPELVGGEGGVPLTFFRDHDKNQLMAVQDG